jgi:hypothetical protein
MKVKKVGMTGLPPAYRPPVILEGGEATYGWQSPDGLFVVSSLRESSEPDRSL